MKFTTKKIRVILRFVTRHPKEAISCFSLAIVISLIYVAANAIDEPSGPVLLITTSAFVLVYTAWLIDQFNIR